MSATETAITVKPEDLTFVYEEGMDPFPFVEDENANITGYGHQDSQRFAEEIDRYDLAAGVDIDPERPGYWQSYIVHRYVRAYETPSHDIYMRPCASTDEGAFPVTTLWGQR